MRIFSACLIIFLLLFFLTVPLSLAHTDYQFPSYTEGQVNEALAKTVPIRFLPSNPLYFLITVKETVSRFFRPSSLEKARFDSILSGKRLKETYLLLEKGDIKNASKSLRRYLKRLDSMNRQTEKARSQNQSVVAFIDETAEGLKLHEVLLSAISKKWQNYQEGYNFDDNFDAAFGEFINTILTIDNIKPGLKNRFKTATSSATLENGPSAAPTPSPSLMIQDGSPSAKPRRIIY